MNFSASDVSLPGCRAIVSGAAGTAGQLCARELAGHGVELVLVDIDRMMVNRLAVDLGATAYGFDVLSDASVRQFMRSVRDQPGCGNLLINAAGTGHVRTLGMTRLTRAFADLTQAASATVVNIASSGPNRDPFQYGAQAMAFHRAAEETAAKLRRANLQVLSFGAGAPDSQIVDALRQWRRSCAASLQCGPNVAPLALSAGRKP